MTDNKIDNKTAIQLWYGGLGEVYRVSRGGGAITVLSMMVLHDSPKVRFFSYLLGGCSLLVMSAGSFIVGFDIILQFQELLILGLSIICWLVGLLGGYWVVRIFQSAFKLHSAIKNNTDTDEKDPLRIKAIKRAVKWGQRKGYLKQDSTGNWYFKQTLR